MTDATNFSDLLSMSAEEAKAPKPLPTGTYTFNVKGHEFGESTKKHTKYVQFNVNPINPEPDVDMEALNAFENWNQKEMRLTFYLTTDSIFRLKDFMEHCGMNISGRTFDALIPEVTGSQFNGNIEHSVSDDGKTTYGNIGSTGPVA